MMPQAALGTTVAISFLVWGFVAARYAWPALSRHRRDDAIRALLTLHTFRFEGLAFLVPGVVGADLPAGFAVPAAFGDLMAAILALLALATLRYRFGVAVTWIFGLWGTADLLDAFYQGNHARLAAGQLGAGYFIVTVFAPLLLVTHALVFRLLLQRRNAESLLAVQAA